MHGSTDILINLAVSLSIALIFGLVTHRLRLSPIVGYLLAGVVLGPQTPGFVADQATASQFAEIGVVLLMFGVGLHFQFSDLLRVRRVAIPGAVGQITVATLMGAAGCVAFGLSVTTGIVIGIAISVASTVVLIRVLMDNNVLQASEGTIAVGWLIVEDLFTVLVLVVLPALAVGAQSAGEIQAQKIGTEIALAMGRLLLLALSVYVFGKRAIPWLLRAVARTRSRELFVLATLTVALAVALGSAALFGVSVALGAFLAGVIVAQSEVSHQVAADALPMRDAFAVLFFVSVGMLFDPFVLWQNAGLFATLIAVILIGKPLAALGIVWFLGYSVRTGLTVALGLAQIGEFSFILADLARANSLLSRDMYSLLTACALVSIAINPILFRVIAPLEMWLHSKPRLWRILTKRAERTARAEQVPTTLADYPTDRANAIIVGHGTVGKTIARVLRKFDVSPTIIELNVDTVRTLNAQNERVVFGDASNHDVLIGAGIEHAKYLIITNPDLLTRMLIIMTARECNPDIAIVVRARYLKERAWLDEVGVTDVCYEEAQSTVGMTQLILQSMHVDRERIQLETQEILEKLPVAVPMQ